MHSVKLLLSVIFFSFIFIKKQDKKSLIFASYSGIKNNNFSNEIKLRKKQITNLKTLGLKLKQNSKKFYTVDFSSFLRYFGQFGCGSLHNFLENLKDKNPTFIAQLL